MTSYDSKGSALRGGVGAAYPPNLKDFAYGEGT